MSDIELIDSYLANELEGQALSDLENRLTEDEVFRKEVEIYKQLKLGIEQVEDENLRNRIAQYEERYWTTPTTVFTPTRITWISGIAASFLVIVLVYIYHKPDSPKTADLPKEQPKEVNTDSTSETPKVYEPNSPKLADEDSDKSSESSELLKQRGLAFGGQVKLPSEQVKSIVYPQQLEYVFDGSVLTIFGDPLIPVLRLDIYLVEDNYFLSYMSAVYRLNITSQPEVLQKESITLDLADAALSDQRIKVAFSSLLESASDDSELDVILKKSSLVPSYYYQSTEGEHDLVVTGNFHSSDVRIFTINHELVEHRYAIINGDLYQLTGTPSVKKTMKSVDFSKNDLSRLFQSRDSIDLRINIFH